MTAAGAADQYQAARCLALDAMAAAASAALAAAGIPSILLKGPVTSRLLHPDRPGQRRYSDVDLLVAPAAFDAAQEVLAVSGYRSPAPGAREDEWSWHERPWRAPGPVRLTIDLHRGFAGVGDPEAFWTAVASSADRLSLAGTIVAVPDVACSALLIGLHTGRSDKPGADLVRALDVLPLAVWERAAGIARDTRAASAFAAGLRRTPAGAVLAAALGLPEQVTPVEWMRAARVSPTGYSLAVLAAQPGHRARLRWLRRRLLPSAAYLRVISPLARQGRAGLTLAHIQRLARHARGLPRGLRDLQAARAQARGSTGGPPRSTRPAGSTVRRAVAALRAGGWAFRARRRVRRQLAHGCRLEQVSLGEAPAGGRAAERAVAAVLRWGGSTCLESALVRQRWYASQRRPRVLVIGSTGPGAGFQAHAWLEGDTGGGGRRMVEILRWPPPPAGPDAAGRPSAPPE